MNVLVTGSTGFIPSHLVQKLVDLGHTVIGTTRKENIQSTRKIDYWICNLTNPYHVKNLFCYEFSHIFHFAANPLTDLSKTTIKDIYDSNLGITLNLLNHTSNCKFVYASSVTIYDDLDLWKGADEKCLPKPSSVYGATKLASEAAILALARRKNMEPLILRYAAICGPGSTHGAIHDLYKKYKQEEKVQVIGTNPGTRKPYLYIDDAIEATTKLAFSDKTGIYNVANNDSLSIESILKIIKGELNVNKEEIWSGETWFGDNPTVNVDTTKIFKDIEWKPSFNSSEAVKKTIQSYENKREENYLLTDFT